MLQILTYTLFMPFSLALPSSPCRFVFEVFLDLSCFCYGIYNLIKLHFISNNLRYVSSLIELHWKNFKGNYHKPASSVCHKGGLALSVIFMFLHPRLGACQTQHCMPFYWKIMSCRLNADTGLTLISHLKSWSARFSPTAGRSTTQPYISNRNIEVREHKLSDLTL